MYGCGFAWFSFSFLPIAYVKSLQWTMLHYNQNKATKNQNVMLNVQLSYIWSTTNMILVGSKFSVYVILFFLYNFCLFLSLKNIFLTFKHVNFCKYSFNFYFNCLLLLLLLLFINVSTDWLVSHMWVHLHWNGNVQ